MSKELGVEFRFSRNRQLQIGVAGGMDGENRQEKKMHVLVRRICDWEDLDPV